MRRSWLLLARRKHGQKGWSPNASSSGAAPATGITAQEALQVAYRPMPPSQTVEYEEDFGPNMMIHREFISKKYVDQMSHSMTGLAYSDLELRSAQRNLADVMNRERRGVLVGDAGSDGDRVHFNVDVDNDTRQVNSARYLFNEKRMLFCDRFQEYFRTRAEREAPEGAGMEQQFLFSLMEACAILHGCDTADAQEVYYRLFMGTDLDSLEKDAARCASRVQDAQEVTQALSPLQQRLASSSVEEVQRLIDTVPDLFGDEDKSEAITAASATTGSVSEEVLQAEPQAVDAATPEGSTPAVPVDHAPIYKAYLAHARGESPIGSYDVSDIVASESLENRRRWRALMEKVASERFHELTADEMRDAVVLNGQLHTVKFMDIKVGDTVREIVQLLQRDASTANPTHRDSPLEASDQHPDRRV